MRILLTGKHGQLGWELHRQLEQDYEVIALGREDIDFRDSKFMLSMLRSLPKCDLIVNAAAYTDVDKAEREPFIAEAINSEALALLATEADRRGIPMIHFSTNHVFSGRWRKSPYREMDRPNPMSCYGRTKLEGELRIKNILEKHLIFRLSGLYGIRRRNFFTTMLSRNRSGISPRIANDQFVSPNWTPLVAEVVAYAIKRLLQDDRIPWGIYHLSGGGSTTPYEFARLIFGKIRQVWGGNVLFPTPSASRALRVSAKRPKYSVLDSTHFSDTFHYALPGWYEQFLYFFGGLQPNL